MTEEYNSPDDSGIGLAWRIAMAVIALVVIAIIAYPFIQNQLSAPSAATGGNERSGGDNPDSAQAQFELGNQYAQTGEWDQAVAAYNRSIELDPSHQGAYANLGVVYYQQGEFDLAIAQYQKALELDPDDGEVAYNLGALYLQQALSATEMGQPDPALLEQAIKQLQYAIELSPNLAEPYFSLGVAYGAQNQKQQAIEAFETYLERETGQDPFARQKAEEYLEALQTTP